MVELNVLVRFLTKCTLVGTGVVVFNLMYWLVSWHNVHWYGWEWLYFNVWFGFLTQCTLVGTGVVVFAVHVTV